MGELKHIYINAPEQNTPAWLDVDNHAIMLNIPYFEKLPGIYKKFIIAHEEGHYKIPTLNELEADFYAFRKLAGSQKGSLKGMVDTIANVLPFSSSEHQQRLVNMYCNAMLYNYNETKDEQYLSEIHRVMNIYGYNPFDPLEIAEVVEKSLIEDDHPKSGYILLHDLKSASFNPVCDSGEPFDNTEQAINETTTSGPITTGQQNPPTLAGETQEQEVTGLLPETIKAIKDNRAIILLALILALAVLIIIK